MEVVVVVVVGAIVVVGGEVVGAGAVVVVDCSVVVGEASEVLVKPRTVEVLSDGISTVVSVLVEAVLSVAVTAGAETELSEASLQLEANNTMASRLPKIPLTKIDGRANTFMWGCFNQA